MFRPLSRLSLRLSLLVLLLPLLARAQTPQEGTDALDQEYRKHRQLLPQLFKGSVEADPNNKEHVAALDAAARYATTRFLWDLYQKDPGKIDRVYQDFDKDVVTMLRNKEKTKAAAQLFTQRVISHAKEILALPEPQARPVARVNIARVLARLADLEQGEVADPLTDVVKSPNASEAVKYYACRGLYNLLKLPVPEPPAPPVVSKAQEEKAAAALAEFIQRKVPFTASTPRAEVDGYRVVRREAIRALAQTHNPAVGAARPALVLLRVAGRDESVVPEPRLDERLEAAVGVARMKSAAAPGYQPDYAAWVVGRFVVDFVNTANGNSKEAKSALRSRPWRIDAARLGEALDALKADSKDKYVQSAVDQAVRVVSEVEGGRQPDPTALNTWLAGNEPPHKELFKDVPESAIKPAAAGE